MRRTILVAGVAVLFTASGTLAQQSQERQLAPTTEVKNTLQERLRPPAAPVELAPRLTPAERETMRPANPPARSTAALRGRSVAYMIAGGALFIGGLLVEGEVGAVMALAGAGIGAYGLYLHFR